MIQSLRVVALLLLALSLSTFPSVSWAAANDDIELIQRNTPRISAIMSSVAIPGGKVDRTTHQEFWTLIPTSIRTNPQSFVEKLDIVRSMAFQKELWESIRLSARAGRVVKTLSYKSALAKTLGHGTAGQDAALRADQMLTAAATGNPFQGSKGTQLLTEDLANQVLDELNSSTERLRLLLDPVWRGHGATSSN